MAPLQRTAQIPVAISERIQFGRCVAIGQKVLDGCAPSLRPFVHSVRQCPIRVSMNKYHRTHFDLKIHKKLLFCFFNASTTHFMPIMLLSAKTGLRTKVGRCKFIGAIIISKKFFCLFAPFPTNAPRLSLYLLLKPILEVISEWALHRAHWNSLSAQTGGHHAYHGNSQGDHF